MQFGENSLDFGDAAFGAADDVQERSERLAVLAQYVPHCQMAYRERGLRYPFRVAAALGDRLEILPGQEGLAHKIGRLSETVGIGQGTAKRFEERAARALHRLLGGSGVCVGEPRQDRSGCKKAMGAFRAMFAEEAGQQSRIKYPARGDFGADALWVLGRSWGGPIVLMQAKNGPFDRDAFALEVVRAADTLFEWFGRPIAVRRSLIHVCAVNTVLTAELKELAFAAARPGAGYHVLDAVDIVQTEQMNIPPSSFSIM